jgi:signal transduction histidine kinase
MTVGANGALLGQEQAHLRLQHLYEISKLFAGYEDIDQTVDPALSLINQTLQLRSAILTEAEGRHSRRVVWRAEGVSPEHLQAVKEYVEAAHSYLVGDAPTGPSDMSERPGKTALPWTAETEAKLGRRFIVMPLVVPHGPPFGTLALEGSRTLDKTDLIFVNAIANQLAIALDRNRAWQQDIIRRVRAEAGRLHAEAMGAAAERERAIAEGLREKSEALAADNARLYEQAQQAVHVREQILAIVSHDLRNPLGTILLTTGILAKKAVQENVVQKERRAGLPLAVGRIKRAAERMLRLIEDLLDFASIETGRLAITCEPQEPAAIIDETLASFESATHEKELRLTAEIQSGLPKIYCDRDRILQVLSNLVGNAIKITGEAGQITLRVEAHAEGVLFGVSDDGPGIAEEDLKHLFERYWRSGEAQYKGTGLGLAIARGIVAAHGGRIWVESELGLGATFWFTVPTVGGLGRAAGEPADA